MKLLMISFLAIVSFKIEAQTITTFAGGGTVIGDGGAATSCILNQANGGAFDKYGNYYVTEVLGHRVRKISPSGIVTRVAGTGSSGSIGDGGPATDAMLSRPTDVVVDTFGNVFISDLNNFKIRKIDHVTGVISTFAGTGVAGFNGDGIPATDAKIQGNEQIWLDIHGNLFICDRDNFRIRKVDNAGIISTVAGGTFSGAGSGDGGPATAATFNLITGVAVDDIGNIYIADYNCGRIRKVNTSGIISTIAGNGAYTYLTDGIPAIAAQFAPNRLTFDKSKNLIIADKYNRRILRIDNSTGIIHSISGSGGMGFSGDGGPATAATLDFPAGIVFDTCDNLYIAESINKRVRKVTFNQPPCEHLEVRVTPVNIPISIYPNPAFESLHINCVAEETNVNICSFIGSTILTAALRPGTNEIDIHTLPAAIYLLILQDNQGNKTIRKFIKQ